MSSVSSTDGGYSYYQRQLGDLEAELRSEKQRLRERASEQSSALEANYQKAQVQKDRETEELADRLRQSTSERIDQERENARAEVEKERARSYDRMGKASAEASLQRRRSEEEVLASQREIDHLHRLDEKRQQASVSGESQSSDRLEQNAQALNRSHEAETKELRQNLKDLIEAERYYMREKGQATTDVHREYANENRTREKVMRDQYSREIDKLKRDGETSDQRHSDVSNEKMKDNELRSALLLEKANREHHASDQERDENFDRFYQQQKELTAKTELLGQKRNEQLAETLGERQKNTLNRQATTYNELMRNQSDRDQERINHLQTLLTRQATTDDSSLVSASIENALSRQYAQKYEKLEKANTERMQGKTESIQQNYQERLRDEAFDKQRSLTESETHHQLEHQRDRQAFVDHVTELELSQQEGKRRTEAEAASQMAALSRNHGHSLEKQRQDYEAVLAQTRLDAQLRMAELQQKAAFDAKMAQRSFAQQNYATIHDYEKKLNDQKNLSDDQMEEMKNLLAQSTRDGERRSKQMLEEQAKGYEQRIQQMEFQSKERERIISESYQDQLEKMKRSNALLQKKG